MGPAGPVFLHAADAERRRVSYAIALYVFSAPWTAFTRDYVSLLRIVVCAAEALAGGLLYVLISRVWGDRRAGAFAVLLFSVVPVSYGVIGNANLTNAFGQSAALVHARGRDASGIFPGRYGIKIAGLSLLAALAFLSHVSTIALLATTLVALVALYWLVGGRAMRTPARSILVATIVAAVFSVAIYYGHFGDVYRNLGRTTAAAPVAALSRKRWGAVCAGGQACGGDAAHAPVAGALDLSVWSIGWPIAILAAVGLWRTWVAGARDRLALLVAALGVAFVAFLGVAIFPRVNVSFERYAAEFVAASIPPPTRRPSFWPRAARRGHGTPASRHGPPPRSACWPRSPSGPASGWSGFRKRRKLYARRTRRGRRTRIRSLENFLWESKFEV